MRTIKLLLATVAILAVMCAGAAFAAADKKIMWGASGIEGPTDKTEINGKYYAPNDYIYYGMNNGTGPIKWRVLDTKTNIGTDGLFLLSEWVLGSDVYFNKKYHYDDVSSQYHRGDAPAGGDHSACVAANVYQGSDAQAWCGTFAENASNFSAAEQAAFLGVSKDDAAGRWYNISWLASSLTEAEDKMFFLSVHELAEYVGDHDYAPGLRAYRDASAQEEGKASMWWLRSPRDYILTHDAGAVDGTGNVEYDHVYDPWAARPAFNLDLNSVLFTSAAAGGKSGGAAAGENFFKNADNSSNEWKVTLLDSSRSGFKAEASRQTGDTVRIKYSGAKTGQNEYISAIIKDSSDNISHYGRLGSAADNAQGNTVTLTLPQGFNASDDTLYIFNEQVNGDHKTDYASELKKIELYTVTAAHDSNGTADASPKNAVKDTEITLSATPITPGYVFDKWEVVKPTKGLTITGDKFTMPDEPVEVKATFKPLPPGEYAIIVSNDGNGTGTADPSVASKDITVTLIASPDVGYEFSAWEVIKPTSLKIADDKFTMPDEPVEVKATFKALPPTPTPDPSPTPPPAPTPSYTTGKYNGAIDRDRSDTLWDSRVGGDMTIHIDVDFDQFAEVVSLDDEPLVIDTTVSHDFGARSGSTIVTIWEKTLKEHITTDGEHTAEIGFKDGSAIHTFDVRGTGETPPQKQSTSGGACASGAFAPLVAMIGLAVIALRRRNR